MSSLLPVALAVALGAAPISVKFEGPLKNAIEQIADKGGLNVVVTADLDENVKVSLTSLSPEEALETIAKIYKLDVTKEGKLWVIRREQTSAAGAPLKGGEKKEALEQRQEGLQLKVNDQPVVTIPPIPPIPALPGSVDPEVLRDVAEQAREQAEAARDRAEELRDQARELADARREQAEALHEEVKARAEELKARGESARDVWVTGGPAVVKVNTTVDNAVAYGGPVVVEENAVVQGDATAFGGDVILKSNARINGDAVAFGGQIVKGPNATIGGEEVAMGGGSLGHSVANKVVKEKKARATEDEGWGVGGAVSRFLLSFALFFGFGFLLMMFAPQRMKQLEAAIARQPITNGFAGLLGLFVAIPLTVLLAVTLIGIPVAVLMWFAIPLAMFAGVPAIANVIGARIPLGRTRRTQALVLAVGLAVLLLVAQVPIAGSILMVLVSLISLGAIIRTRFGQSPKGTPVPDTIADHVPA